MYRNGALLSKRCILPYCTIDILRRIHRIRMFHQKFQDCIFCLGQVHRLSINRNLLRPVIQAHSADLDRICRQFLRDISAKHHVTAQLCLYSCDHNNRVKWFGNIVVGANRQTKDLICIFTFRCEQNDRNIGRLANLVHRCDTIHHRHHDVHQYKLHITGFQLLTCLLSVVRFRHPVPFCRQVNTKCLHDILLIITD